jgi:uncharacterized protein (DUF433 family)
MERRPFISVDPQVIHGAARTQGTRIRVSIVPDNLAAGETPATIAAEYPSLTLQQISPALAYAAGLATERFVPTVVQR